MKNFKSLFLLALAIAFSSISIAAQEETGGVKGKVRTAKGGGIGGVGVTVKLNGADVKSAKSDEKGNFVLNGLKPDIYNIIFDKNGYSSGIKYNVEVKKGRISDLGDRLILNTDLGTQIIVKGSVFDQSGRSVYGAKIEIQKVNGDGSTAAAAQKAPGSQGRTCAPISRS